MKSGRLWSTVYRNNLRYTGVCIRIRDCLKSLLTESSLSTPPPLPPPHTLTHTSPLSIASVFCQKHSSTMVYIHPHQKYKNISSTACVTFIKKRVWKTAVDETKALRGIYC